jgi:hypothetical protein
MLLKCETHGGQKYPLLSLRCFGASGSDQWISNLLVDQIYYRDSLRLNVLGYYHLDHSNISKNMDYIDTFDILFARKHIMIPISTLDIVDTMKIVIQLKGRRNSYNLIRDNLIVKLDPLIEENIKIEQVPYKNFQEVILFPSEIYRIYIAGKVDRSIDYESDLIQYSESQGYLLANMNYPQIPKGFRGTIIYVIGEDTKDIYIPRGTALPLGNLPGFPDIEVLISNAGAYCDHGNIREN